MESLFEAAVVANTPDSVHRKRTALVVDDDADIRPLVETVLAGYNFAIDGVGDGASALARLRARVYDLIILDLGMPEVDGYEVLRAMNKTLTLPNIPVIVLTGNGSEEALVRSFGCGANDFVTKPFNPIELALRAHRLVQPRSSPSVRGAEPDASEGKQVLLYSNSAENYSIYLHYKV